MYRSPSSSLASLLLIGCLWGWISRSAADTFDASHARWSRLLTLQVKSNLVDYAALKAAPAELDTYLNELAAVNRDQFDEWTESTQIAFLLNLYNATTCKLITDHYPVASIKKIGGFFGSPWRQKVVRLWGEVVTLEYVEHGLLRAKYVEPRLHFALVCGARGCPPLRTEAYTGDRLDVQLREQGRQFLGDPTKNRVETETQTLWLSPIFKWFKEDFTAEGLTVGEFVLPFLPEANRKGVSTKDFKIRYTDYDWSLNGR